MSLLPETVTIDAMTGALSPATGHYAKHLADLEGLFQDATAWANAVAHGGNPLVYEVIEYRKDGSDLFFGTTTMQPGRVGTEFYMTRGHFHSNPAMGEVYYTRRGEGLLLLENRGGESRHVPMRAGSCAFIPPGWAHRSVNTGDEPLVFVWVCNPAAGHDYAAILDKGLRQIAVEQDGAVAILPNPRFTQG